MGLRSGRGVWNRELREMKKENLLTLLIALGLILGVLVGQFLLFDSSLSDEALRGAARPWQTAGEIIFIRPLMMMIVPLVFVSVAVGVASIGNPQRLGLVGGATLLFYLCSMAAAVTVGLTLVTLIAPGVGVDAASLTGAAAGAFESGGISARISGGPSDVGSSFVGLVYSMIPGNFLKAAVEGETLPVVVGGIIFGLALVLGGEKCRVTIQALEGAFEALIRLVMWVIWLAPVGIFFIVAGRVGQVGLVNLVGPLGWYVLTVVLGLVIQGVIVLPLALWILGKTNPYRFMWAVRKVIVTAFSTASSAATLPVSLEECQTVGRCSRRASNFVIPLGATINMDGTALYQAVAVVFLFQMFGFDLTLGQMIIILVTATLAAVGAAGIPSAGLVTMAIVINAVNASLGAIGGEGARTLPMYTVGIILGVDRVLDMCRTAVNVWGDCVGARIITRIAPDEDDERERALA